MSDMLEVKYADEIYLVTLPQSISMEAARQYCIDCVEIYRNNVNKKLRFLVDCTECNKLPSTEIRDVFVGLFKRNRVFAKSNNVSVKNAFFGFSASTRIAMRLTITLSGRRDMRIFDTQQECLAWLKE